MSSLVQSAKQPYLTFAIFPPAEGVDNADNADLLAGFDLKRMPAKGRLTQ